MNVIIYIDMNSFFVSCHQAKDASLKNKPVVVSKDSRRAVVASASYEARKYYIKSAMPLYQAYNLCPDLIKVNADFKLYTNYSKRIFTFLNKKFTNQIERCSIDEYCLDVTNIYQRYTSALKCAQAIQEQILKQFDLPCSIGISFNKPLAKIASKLEKPQGIAIINRNNLKEKLHPLAINKIDGIGPKTSVRLNKINIYKIGDLAISTNYQAIEKILGKRYWTLIKQAQGRTKENITLNAKENRKSVGCDQTLEYDSNDEVFLKTKLKQLANEVALRAKKQKFTARTLVFGFKVKQNKWSTKQCQLESATNEKTVIYQTIISLFEKNWNHQEGIRALRVALKKQIKKI